MGADTKTSLLDALAPGDMTSMPDEGQTIEVAGRTFYLQSFIGDKDRAILVIASKPGLPPISELVSRCMHAASNLLVMVTDFNKATIGEVAHIALAAFMADLMETYRQHLESEASKGRPS